MRLGFTLPQFGALARRPDQIGRFAGEVERLGARSVWVGDRLLAAVRPKVGYGGGDSIPEQFRTVLDPFVSLTVAASATEHVTVGTNVLNLPWYSPAVLSRSLASIDLLSGGRLLPGFGIGWSPEEYEAAGVPWQRRGARLDESLDALEALWRQGSVEHHGEFYSVPESYIEAKPAQRPRPPLYLAGFGPAALRRIGRRADGWLPVIVLPGRASADEIIRQREAIRHAAAEAGREGWEPGAVLRVNVAAGVSAERIVDAIGSVREATGIEDAFVDPMYLVNDVDESLALAQDLLKRIG